MNTENINNKQPRKRATNFSEAEKIRLIDFVSHFKHILENKNSDMVNLKEKDKYWKKIEQMFNSSSSSTEFRSSEVLKSCWDNNLYSILNGQYEDVLNNDLSAYTIKAVSNGDNLEEIVHKDIIKNDTHLLWLQTGIASLLYFGQCNWTGPCIDKNIDWLASRRSEALKELSLHDECNINVQKPELLWLSKKIFSNLELQLKYKSCIWWLFRANLLHQCVLDENLGILFEETENLIVQISGLRILEDLLCKLLFNLEVARFYLYHRRTQSSERYLECAQNVAGLTLSLEGAMGKRTKYQQEEKAQLYLKVEINKDIFPSINCEDMPKSVNLDDELRLERIEFSECKEETQLGMLEEAVILAKYVQLQLCQPKHKLTDEEIKPYLTRVIENTRNWSLKMTSLCHRCSLESDDKRTVERSMMQAESLLNDYNNGEASVARRMDLFFASGMKPIWTLKEKWANVMFSLGLVKGALQVFIELGLSEDAIVCYHTLNLKHKAAEIIQQELSKRPTVKLWCLLGDATGDVDHYETAWKLSEGKSSRVQRHWGFYHFAKKDYVKAVPHLKLSVELNNIQELVWFRLGYAALQTEDWKLAATAYRRYCALEQSSFEAWNNLAKAYIKLGDKPRAWKSLQDAIKCNYDRWEVWDNLMVVSVDLGHFSEVIRCYHRILDLRGNYSDIQVLQILVDAIINNINDADGNTASRLLQSSLTLFGRITSSTTNSPDIWRMYAQLTALRKTDVDAEKAAQYLQQAHRAAVSNPNWPRSEDTIQNVLELCRHLAQAYLRCITDIAIVKKRKMLGSAKLSLQAVVKKVKEQERSNENIDEQLAKVEEYLAIITNELEQIKLTQ
ncbi:Tetratricopeptide repeat protein [Ooceraea biroi]|uniref:Regulatory protein zeste n=1 Tax=Ooceraea biroi TaxID=2015173 RepID=A0A026VUD9_OOCBI|nr:Tetratricopeptide repeat protein [Ooceraea biroi]